MLRLSLPMALMPWPGPPQAPTPHALGFLLYTLGWLCRDKGFKGLTGLRSLQTLLVLVAPHLVPWAPLFTPADKVIVKPSSTIYL